MCKLFSIHYNNVFINKIKENYKYGIFFRRSFIIYHIHELKMSAIKNWYSHLNNNNNKQSSSSNSNINPFDERNKIRLEQSVLSPNLFHIASNNSSIEVFIYIYIYIHNYLNVLLSMMYFKRNSNNSIWNIDQRAVLYPADIPTDDKSLIPQYLW